MEDTFLFHRYQNEKKNSHLRIHEIWWSPCTHFLVPLCVYQQTQGEMSALHPKDSGVPNGLPVTFFTLKSISEV